MDNPPAPFSAVHPPDPAGDQVAGDARVRKLEAELARTRLEFAALNNRLSHDMQGILRNIASFAHHIRDAAQERLLAREVQYLGRIEAGALRGANIARDLTSLSAVATTELRPTTVDPAHIAAQAVRDLHPALEGRNVQIDLPQGPGPQVHADLVLARLAVWHLLSNAIKFTRPVKAARIQVTAQADHDSCVIAVSDNGVGFSQEYAYKLFAPFERLHYDSEFEGNGIGLAMVREIALRHGGRFGVDPADGEGARFWIALPLAGRTAPATLVAPGAAHAARATRRLILAVDDEPLVLMTVKTLLERDGNEVITAVGGAEGLRLMQSLAGDGRNLDLVISDWLMPQVGGAEIARAAKEFHPASRVVLLTGLRPEAGTDHEMPRAVDGIVAKPVRAAELRRVVAGAVPS